MNWTLLFTCLLIALARVTDVTLDTIRVGAVVQGRRGLAAGLGFVGSMIYLLAVAKVLRNFDHFVYAIAYAGGFASGTFLGMTIERRLALGEQIVSVFTRKATLLAPALREMQYRVTEFQGRGRDGQVTALYIEVPRRHARRVIEDARRLDSECFYMVNDVRMVRPPSSKPARIFRIAA